MYGLTNRETDAQKDIQADKMVKTGEGRGRGKEWIIIER